MGFVQFLPGISSAKAVTTGLPSVQALKKETLVVYTRELLFAMRVEKSTEAIGDSK